MPTLNLTAARKAFPLSPEDQKRKLIGRMGPWQLVRLLGEGTLTRVYLARPLSSPESAPAYAIKVLRKEWWQDKLAIETLRREALVGKQLSDAKQCPHLPALLSAHVDQPPFYLVTPRLLGETVAEKLAEGRLPSLPQALWIARQAAAALQSLHQTTGMIHGDVKPSNLFVSPDGHTTLIDLGFCQTPAETRSWADRPVVGTLNYMAPERITSACSADIRSDLYCLGVTLYEMLTGRLPFEASEPAELIAQHRSQRPEPLGKLCPELPAEVVALVDRLLAKDPMRRFDAPQELASTLVRLEIACFAKAS